jgi:hypothetical protein
MENNMKSLKIKVSKTNTRAFTNWSKYFGWKMQNYLFSLMENFAEGQYSGGLWGVGYIGKAGVNSYFPIPPHDDGQSFKVTNALNYYDGEMTPRALGICLLMITLSDMSGNGGVVGRNAGTVYHQFRELVFDCIESDEAGTLTKEEGRSIIKFLD